MPNHYLKRSLFNSTANVDPNNNNNDTKKSKPNDYKNDEVMAESVIIPAELFSPVYKIFKIGSLPFLVYFVVEAQQLSLDLNTTQQHYNRLTIGEIAQKIIKAFEELVIQQEKTHGITALNDFYQDLMSLRSIPKFITSEDTLDQLFGLKSIEILANPLRGYSSSSKQTLPLPQTLPLKIPAYKIYNIANIPVYFSMDSSDQLTLDLEKTQPDANTIKKLELVGKISEAIAKKCEALGEISHKDFIFSTLLPLIRTAQKFLRTQELTLPSFVLESVLNFEPMDSPVNSDPSHDFSFKLMDDFLKQRNGNNKAKAEIQDDPEGILKEVLANAKEAFEDFAFHLTLNK